MDEKFKILVKNSKIQLEDVDKDIDEIYSKVAEYVKNAEEYDRTTLALMGWMLQVRNCKLELTKENKNENRKKEVVIDFETNGILQQEA
ncbi:MAG TPA: hypothetical protein PKN54_07285 [Candidatus Cloacimonas acidaminovorans]|jgi:hypothetical protein|nr:hypothetical protein [Candidatus Cloacimonas acidaminovorans]